MFCVDPKGRMIFAYFLKTINYGCKSHHNLYFLKSKLRLQSLFSKRSKLLLAYLLN